MRQRETAILHRSVLLLLQVSIILSLFHFSFVLIHIEFLYIFVFVCETVKDENIENSASIL